MEIEQLRVACDLMRRIERRDPEELLSAPAFERALKFESNKAYVRQVLESQVDLTAQDSEFVPVDSLPADHRYFEYQRRVNGDGCPTEEVIARNAQQNGEYRLETEGPHPVPGLGTDAVAKGAATDYARRTSRAA